MISRKDQNNTPKICVYAIYTYMHVCVPCVILMFSRIHSQEAKVLSVRFPKENDHINLAAKHPKLCTIFHSIPC